MGLTLNGDKGIEYANLYQDIKSLLMPKNWIINGQFDVWQRGTSQTTDGYGSDDRWYNSSGYVTKTNSRQAFTIGQTDVPNNPTYFSRTILSSPTTAWAYKQQRIEDVTKLAGKQVAVSFWAKADVNRNVSLELTQFLGAGGSPEVTSIGVQKFALTTVWKKFTKIVTIPSVVGKTLGINHFLGVNIWFCALSDLNARTDSLGVQSGTFDIANVSLVEGSVAIECQNQPYADVLRECRRYYRKFGESEFYGNGNTSATNLAYILVNHEGMRVVPIIDYISLVISRMGESSIAVTSCAQAIGGKDSSVLSCNGTGFPVAWSAVALNGSGGTSYLAFSAEL